MISEWIFRIHTSDSGSTSLVTFLVYVFVWFLTQQISVSLPSQRACVGKVPFCSWQVQLPRSVDRLKTNLTIWGHPAEAIDQQSEVTALPSHPSGAHAHTHTKNTNYMSMFDGSIDYWKWSGKFVKRILEEIICEYLVNMYWISSLVQWISRE